MKSASIVSYVPDDRFGMGDQNIDGSLYHSLLNLDSKQEYCFRNGRTFVKSCHTQLGYRSKSQL